MGARVERFITGASQGRDQSNGEAADVDAVNDGQDDEQDEEPEPDMDLVRLMPPRKPAEELEVEQVPEPEPDPVPDRFDLLGEAFISALSGGNRAADDSELMRRLRQSGVRFEASEFFAALGELVEDGVVVSEPDGCLRLTESSASAVT